MKSPQEIRKPGMVPGLGLWQEWVRNYLSASRAEQSWDKPALTGGLMTSLLSSRMSPGDATMVMSNLTHPVLL